MSNVKTAPTAPQAAASAEKEFAFVRQQAELRSHETAILQASEAITEQRENAQSSDDDTQQEHSKDTATISETRRWFLTDGTISADQILPWKLEMEEKDWEVFLNWQPVVGLDLPKQLQELSGLYLSLLEAALKYAEGQNLTEQMERLDSLLAEKLDLVMEKNLKQLTVLLEETGQTTTLDSIRSSLYRQTAGKTISYQAAHSLFTHGGAAGGRSGRSLSASSSMSRDGMIYQSSGKQNARFQQTCYTQQTSWKEQIRQRNEIISNARKGIAQNTFQQGSSVYCSGKELVKANRFAAHINGSGNLFKNPEISARNQEVTGLLAAVMSIKGQVYAGEGSKNGSITFSLQNAIEKIIDQYLRFKGSSKVYYHTLAAYKQTKNPQKAIQEGQDYARRQFREKQSEAAYEKSPHYSKDSGFFRALLKGLSPEKEFAMGVTILQKDWQNFLSAVGTRPYTSSLSGPERYSPWGVLAGAGSHRTGSDGTVEKILLGIAVITLMSGLAVLWFRFL